MILRAVFTQHERGNWIVVFNQQCTGLRANFTAAVITHAQGPYAGEAFASPTHEFTQKLAFINPWRSRLESLFRCAKLRLVGGVT